MSWAASLGRGVRLSPASTISPVRTSTEAVCGVFWFLWTGSTLPSAACWSVLLVLLLFVLMLVIGAAPQLPGWSPATVFSGLRLLLATGLLSVLACNAFSLVASASRGHLAATACIFVTLVLGQVITQLGHGQYFPWSIPLLYSGAAEALTDKAPAPLGAVSYEIVGVVGLLSVIATCIWWRYADQK